jgi:integrase
MASILKRDDKWRAFILINGKRKSKTFKLKKDAVAWANDIEEDGVLDSCTFRELVEKYKPVVETHRGKESELGKINKMVEKATFIDLPVEYITRAMVAGYRDARLREVKPATVNRELVIMSAIFKKAVDDWGLLRKNPVASVSKPACPDARHRGVSRAEEEAVTAALEAKLYGKVVSQMFRLSLETGMRMSEMTGLTWDKVSEKYVILEKTKNGSRREVPLSLAARQIISERWGLDDVLVFPVTSRSATSTFIKAKKRTPYKDVRFHDARSEAVTRLSKKLDVLQLAKMIGHKDLKSLMFYYAESSDTLADRL